VHFFFFFFMSFPLRKNFQATNYICTMRDAYISNPHCGTVIPWFLSAYPKKTGTPP